MASISAGYSVDHYSDRTSHIYPDRPIRPLPKRRLRSRPSPEFTNGDTPLNPNTTNPLFRSSPDENEPLVNHAFTKAVTYNSLSTEGDDVGNTTGFQFRGQSADSDYEDESVVSRPQRDQKLSLAPNQTYMKSVGRSRNAIDHKPPLMHSAASSVESGDGYDSFENTNNKKKRKIPQNGAFGGHHSTLSADMAHMGLSSGRDLEGSTREADGGLGQYYGTGSPAAPATTSGSGLSGAGRGRFGRNGTRSTSGRSPLGPSVNGSNSHFVGRLLQRPPHDAPGSGGQDSVSTNVSEGIISTAIANAAASPSSSLAGQENISLLEQQSAKKPKQFTFTSKSLAWPSQYELHNDADAYAQRRASQAADVAAIQNSRAVSTQATQTSPNIAGQANQTASQQRGSQQPTQQVKKPRRPPAKRYATSARERRHNQAYKNYHNPPRSEDIWICEFCEYESIFGAPPEALVRQYEIKDRRERRRLAEKQRLLEKAKMKGRKGKKGSKNAGKNANQATQPQQPAPKQQHDPQTGEHLPYPDEGQSEDYLLDEYDEDPMPMPNQTPTKIPQPTPQNQHGNLRSDIRAGDPGLGAGSAGRAA